MSGHSGVQGRGAVALGLTVLASALALATGAIHLWIALDYLAAGLMMGGLAFLGMATPYFGGVALYALGFARRWLLRLAPIYVGMLLVVWLFIGARDPLAYIDKLVELALLVVLGVLVYLDHEGRVPYLNDPRQQG